MPLIERYNRTPALNDCIQKIEAAKNRLESHLTKPEEWHGVIRRQVMASVVHYSTKIEGNRLTREQVEAVIAGESIEAAEKDKTEALNYHQAMQWSQVIARDPAWRLTHETILTLHFMIGQNLGSDYDPLGRYREAQNQVADRGTNTVIYWPPRPSEVQPLMDEFVEWIRRRSDSGLNPYVANALAHLNFVAIHPFSDGNGRVCRVLCSLLMMRHGYRSQAFYSLEEYFGTNWQMYGQQIRDCLGPQWPVDPGQINATGWIEWYLGAVLTEVTKAERDLRRAMASLGVVYLALTTDGVTLNRRALAVWLTLREGSVTNRLYRSTVSVQAPTAVTDLASLVDEHYLEMRGARRTAHYVPGPRALRWGDHQELVDLWLNEGADAVAARLRGVPDEPTRMFDVTELDNSKDA